MAHGEGEEGGNTGLPTERWESMWVWEWGGVNRDKSHREEREKNKEKPAGTMAVV